MSNELEKEVFDYLTQIGFNDVDLPLVKMYITMCNKPGWKDGLKIIDPHEIQYIKKLIKDYNK